MNFDDYEQLDTNNIGTNMTAGALAGIMEHLVMYPIDSVKTRMQSLSPLRVGETISSTLSNMIKQEGIMRPLRGVGAVVLGAGPAHAFYFGTYEYTKEHLAKYNINDNVNYIMSATSATLLHDAISNPTEVIKQRLQMYNSPYKSVVDCARTVFRQEGLSAFYRSYTTQLVMNLPYHAIHFSTYEFFQEMLNKERKYNPICHMVAGGAAGAAAAAFTTPLDVCKTLLNTQEAGVGATKGLVDAIKKVHKVAGVKGFFKGMQARVLYQMPATAICWSTYEFFKYMLNRVEKKKETVIISAATSPPLPKEISLQFDDNKKQLHYVLPSNGSKLTNDIPSTSIHPASSPTSGLKPRELPAMSSSGLVYAHTMHTQEKSNASHLTDFRSNT
ncbi:unnamed protein product [Diamesa serratosioi]